MWITSKVAFFPSHDDTLWMFNANNVKGDEAASIALSLEQLQVDYVDLMLIHNPCTEANEYKCSAAPHWFELKSHGKSSGAVDSPHEFFGDARAMLLEATLARAKESADPQRAYEARKASWLALEQAHRDGKAKSVSVCWELCALGGRAEYRCAGCPPLPTGTLVFRITRPNCCWK